MLTKLRIVLSLIPLYGIGALHLPLVTSPVLLAQALPLSANKPQPCIGRLDYSTGIEWGAAKEGLGCPKNFAIVALNSWPQTSRYAKPETIRIQPSCCPLPSEDILSGTVVNAAEKCPSNHIAVGSEPPDTATGISYLRCAEINQKRYTLAAPREAYYWGFGVGQWQSPTHLMKSDIPAAIREAVGRVSKYDWVDQGCVGYPFGSLLTSKSSKRCTGFEFQQLQYIGAAGDPPAGTAVPMLPDCRGIVDIFTEKEVQCRN